MTREKVTIVVSFPERSKSVVVSFPERSKSGFVLLDPNVVDRVDETRVDKDLLRATVDKITFLLVETLVYLGHNFRT